MNIESLASSATTEYELLHPVTEMPTGIFFRGHTPDSSEYKRKEKEIVSGTSKQFITLNKKADPSMELDSSAAEKRKKLMIAVITDIHGAPDFEYSNENKKALLNNPLYSWMVEQWTDHLDLRSNFFPKPEPTA